MASQEGQDPNGNGSQSDSRLKNKKPPSLVIAIPPSEAEDRAEDRAPAPARQQSMEVPDGGASERRAAYSRQTSLSQSIRRGTAQWFGVAADCETQQQVWHRKSLRHCSQRYGRLKAQYRDGHDQTSMDQSGPESPAPCRMQKIVDPLARGRQFRYDDSERPRTPHTAHPAPLSAHTPLTPGATSLCSFTSQRSGYTRLPRRK